MPLSECLSHCPALESLSKIVVKSKEYSLSLGLCLCGRSYLASNFISTLISNSPANETNWSPLCLRGLWRPDSHKRSRHPHPPPRPPSLIPFPGRDWWGYGPGVCLSSLADKWFGWMSNGQLTSWIWLFIWLCDLTVCQFVCPPARLWVRLKCRPTSAQTHQMLRLPAPRFSLGRVPLLPLHWANVNAPSHHPGSREKHTHLPTHTHALTLTLSSGAEWTREASEVKGD